jgi:anti-sigma B factor antagonist
MNIESLVQKNHTLLSFSGRLDATRAPMVQEAFLAALNQGNPNLIVDCTKLEYVASMGLRCFLQAAGSVKAKGGKLVFFGLNESVYHVFEMTGFSKFIPVSQNLEEALDCLKVPEKSL